MLLFSNCKLESDNTFEMINIVLTTLKRKIGSHLSLNDCKVTMLSASAWKNQFHRIINETMSKSLDTLCTKSTEIYIFFYFYLYYNILLVCHNCFKDQIAYTGKSGPASFGWNVMSDCSPIKVNPTCSWTHLLVVCQTPPTLSSLLTCFFSNPAHVSYL